MIELRIIVDYKEEMNFCNISINHKDASPNELATFSGVIEGMRNSLTRLTDEVISQKEDTA